MPIKIPDHWSLMLILLKEKVAVFFNSSYRNSTETLISSLLHVLKESHSKNGRYLLPQVLINKMIQIPLKFMFEPEFLLFVNYVAGNHSSRVTVCQLPQTAVNFCGYRPVTRFTRKSYLRFEYLSRI